MAIDPAQLATFARTGHWHLRGFLDRAQQDDFVEHARALAKVAPFMHPRMRDGREMSVKVSSFGERGWWADEQGYRYINHCPWGLKRGMQTTAWWPPIPIGIVAHTDAALRVWRPIGPLHEVDTCLVNLYEPGAQLGWHVDQTERDRTSPIVTFSIGATCTFSLRMEDDGAVRTFRYTLESGDAIVMAGPSRLAEHKVSDVRPAMQTGLFSANYNPLAATAPGSRLSFTVRRTGWA